MNKHRPERIRVIPALLLRGTSLVKTVRFKNPTYVGDPRIAVKIFNDKEVDELTILDIEATRKSRTPNYDLIREIAIEAFMPVAYGGGVNSFEQIQKLFALGIEKVVLNSVASSNPMLIRKAADHYGSQSIVVSIDVKKNWLGKHACYTSGGTIKSSTSPAEMAHLAQEQGAGEIIINSIDRDGTYTGYDIPLIQQVTEAVSIPVVALGGARSIQDFCQAIQVGHASAVSAGSMFVFQGVHRAVLINFPSEKLLTEQFFEVCSQG